MDVRTNPCLIKAADGNDTTLVIKCPLPKSGVRERSAFITIQSGTIQFSVGKPVSIINSGDDGWLITVATNVVTVDTLVAHGLVTGESISTSDTWAGNTFMASLTGKEITVTSPTTFTFALTQANQSATETTTATATITRDDCHPYTTAGTRLEPFAFEVSPNGDTNIHFDAAAAADSFTIGIA
jgi:hypothetical protein